VICLETVRDRLALEPGQPPWDLHAVEETDSTNLRLWEALGSGSAWDRPWCVLSADSQSAGRGRQERAWSCAPGEGLLVSLCLELDLTRHALALLGHWAAIALARVLEERLDEAGLSARILWKWPNDLWIEDEHGPGKVAGLLAQAQIQGTRARVVLGIGLNCGQREFPAGLRQPARSLHQAGLRLERETLLADLLLELGRRGLPGLGPGLLAELAPRDLFQSRPAWLRLEEGPRRLRSTPLLDGGLRVEWEGGAATLHGGGLCVESVTREGLWCRLEA
jgi:biotin-[acetyl-CoA-carboxylase] ligase BirA-like protein